MILLLRVVQKSRVTNGLLESIYVCRVRLFSGNTRSSFRLPACRKKCPYRVRVSKYLTILAKEFTRRDGGGTPQTIPYTFYSPNRTLYWIYLDSRSNKPTFSFN